MKKFYLLGPLLMIIAWVSCDPGCGTPGGDISVSGPPNDTVLLQLASSYMQSCCPPNAGCVISAPVILDANGNGSHGGLVDGTNFGGDVLWVGTGVFSGCGGVTTLACASTANMSCSAQGTQFQAVGTIPITYVNNPCHYDNRLHHWTCPGPVEWELTIGGAWAGAFIHASLSQSPQAEASAANELANAINYYTGTSSIVAAVANPNGYPLGTVLLLGKTVYTDPSQVDQYGWTLSSATCAKGSSSCMFSATLSPQLTMGTRPPL